MGGNVLVKDKEGNYHKAGKPDFRSISRTEFTANFIEALKKIDDLHTKLFKEPIWSSSTRDKLLSSGKAFNGSSEHLFNDRMKDEEFVEHKPVVGDIDLTVPKEKLKSIFELLSKIQGKSITPTISYIGQNKEYKEDREEQRTGHQINTLFAYRPRGSKTTVNVQIDFEGVEYDKGKPTEFAKFSHSSSWDDVKSGVKGVFHKYILRSLASAASVQENVVILTPESPLEPPEAIKVSKKQHPVFSLYSFSVDGGLRAKAAQQFLPDGVTPVMVNGMRAFKELPTSDSTYARTKKEIFTLIFGVNPEGNELQLLDSYTGILQLIGDHLDDGQIDSIYLDLISNKFFGVVTTKKGKSVKGQALDAYSPDVDRSAKMAAISIFKKKFPFVSSHDALLEKLLEEYYENYKVRVEETFNRYRIVECLTFPSRR